MDSTLLVIAFFSVLCSFNVLPRLILCNFSLVRPVRPVSFLQLSANIYIKTVDTQKHVGRAPKQALLTLFFLLLLLVIGSIATSQNHRDIQNVLDADGQDSRAQLQPWVSMVWDTATAGEETQTWALMNAPTHWLLLLTEAKSQMQTSCFKSSLLEIIFLVMSGPKKQQRIATILQSFFLVDTLFHKISEGNLDAKFPFP